MAEHHRFTIINSTNVQASSRNRKEKEGEGGTKSCNVCMWALPNRRLGTGGEEVTYKGFYKWLQQDPPAGISAKITILLWKAVIFGPDDTVKSLLSKSKQVNNPIESY